jgi:hypothetical protein
MALTQISTAGVKDDAVTSGKIPANAVGSSELADNAVDTAAIADDAVTFAKMQNTADGVRLLGKHDSGGGQIGEITAAQARTMLNVADGATNSPTTTINNNADNRVITGSGTANTLEGESTLTYSGDTLLSTNSNFVIKSIDTNASNAENYIQFNAGYITYDSDSSNSTGYSGHYFQADGAEKLRINGSGQLIFDADTNTYIARPAADTLAVTTGGTERMRIDSSGKVGIGTGTIRLAEQLHVLGNGIVTSSAENTNMGMFGTFGGSDLLVGTFNANNVVVRRGNTNVARFTQNGFIPNGTDTAAANALDDYEEGEWQPAFANGLVASSYESNGQRGQYTKIGNVVHYTAILHLASASTQDGNVIDISGLPYTSGDYSNIGAPAGGMSYFYQDGFYNSNGFTGIVQDTTTTIRLYRADTGAYLTGNSVNGGREIRIRGTYTTPT